MGEGRAIRCSLVVLVLVGLALTAGPVQADQDDAPSGVAVQVEDPTGDVEGGPGAQMAPTADWVDLTAVWFGGENATHISLNVEVVEVPPTTPDRVADPSRVNYTVLFTYRRPAVPGLAGFEDPRTADHRLEVSLWTGTGFDKPGDLLSAPEACRLDDQPADLTRADDGSWTTCTFKKSRLHPDDVETGIEGDVVVVDRADALQDPPGFVDSAKGGQNATYVLQEVDPRPAPQDPDDPDDTPPEQSPDEDPRDTPDDPGVSDETDPAGTPDAGGGSATPAPGAVGVGLAGLVAWWVRARR